jgi:uncharacterized protein YjbI with pentapeptide repeats
MADPEHLAVLAQGVAVWNGWRQEQQKILPDLTAADLSRSDLRGVDFWAARLDRACLVGANLEKADLRGTNFSGADLRCARLNFADLLATNFTGADLREANITFANLEMANLTNANFFAGNPEHLLILQAGVEIWNNWRSEQAEIIPDLRGANFHRLELHRINFNGANLSQANFTQCYFFEADLGGANLCGARLTGSDISGVDLSHADLSRAYLSRARCSLVRLSSANLSGATLHNAELNSAKLVGADLSNADLRQADLFEADLSHANLSGASLFQADLTGAKLVGANLSEATLDRAKLSEADLTDADFSGASLYQTTIVDAIVKGASFSGCWVYGVSAWGLDLSDVKDQSNLLITPRNEAAVTVDNLEVAQFIYLMLHNQKIRDVINTISGKGVLILGRFGAERKAVLDGIKDKLQTLNLVPIVFDWDKPTARDLTETVQLLANMSRFVVADVTDAKSIPQELLSIVPHLPSVPVRPIILAGQREYAMFEHFKKYPWVLPVFEYEDKAHLLDNIEQVLLAPIEAWEAQTGQQTDHAEQLRAKDEEIERLRAALADNR